MNLRKIYFLISLVFVPQRAHANFFRGLERLWDAITGKKESEIHVENIKRTVLTCGNDSRTMMNTLISETQQVIRDKKKMRTEANVSNDNEKSFISKEITNREEAELRKLYSKGSLYTSVEGEICGLTQNEQNACNAVAESNSLGEEILHPFTCDLVDSHASQSNAYQDENAESSVTCVVATKADMDIIKNDKQGYIEDGGSQHGIEQFLKDGKVTTIVEYPACGTGNEQDLKNACLFKLNSGNIIQLRPESCTLIPIG